MSALFSSAGLELPTATFPTHTNDLVIPKEFNGLDAIPFRQYMQLLSDKMRKREKERGCEGEEEVIEERDMGKLSQNNDCNIVKRNWSVLMR